MYLWMNRRVWVASGGVGEASLSGFKSREGEAVVAVHRTCKWTAYFHLVVDNVIKMLTSCQWRKKIL